MGVWGPGVYQSDDACDVLDAVCGPLLAVIERATASDVAMRADVEDLEQLVPALDLLAIVSNTSATGHAIWRGWAGSTRASCPSLRPCWSGRRGIWRFGMLPWAT